MTHEVMVKPVFKWMLIGCLSGVFGTGCIAQKADLQKIHKDLDQQMTQIRTEKKELEKELVAARAAIAESRDLIAAQKADMGKMRSDLAPMNQQIKLMREKDLARVYGNFEEVEKKISDLRKDFTSQVAKLNTDIQALQLRQTQEPTVTSEETTVLLDTMTQLHDALENDKSELWELVKENQARLNTLSAEIAKLKAAQD